MTKKERQFDNFNAHVLYLIKRAEIDIKDGDDIHDVLGFLKTDICKVYKDSQEVI